MSDQVDGGGGGGSTNMVIIGAVILLAAAAVGVYAFQVGWWAKLTTKTEETKDTTEAAEGCTDVDACSKSLDAAYDEYTKEATRVGATPVAKPVLATTGTCAERKTKCETQVDDIKAKKKKLTTDDTDACAARDSCITALNSLYEAYAVDARLAKLDPVDKPIIPQTGPCGAAKTLCDAKKAEIQAKWQALPTISGGAGGAGSGGSTGSTGGTGGAGSGGSTGGTGGADLGSGGEQKAPVTEKGTTDMQNLMADPCPASLTTCKTALDDAVARYNKVADLLAVPVGVRKPTPAPLTGTCAAQLAACDPLKTVWVTLCNRIDEEISK